MKFLLLSILTVLVFEWAGIEFSKGLAVFIGAFALLGIIMDEKWSVRLAEDITYIKTRKKDG